MPVSWSIARRAAREAADALPVVEAPLDVAVGSVLAEPLVALTPLPPSDTARVDGWAVCGPGPWHVVGGRPARLDDGTAVLVDVGDGLPVGSDAVLRAERAVVLEGSRLHVGDPRSGTLAPHPGYVEPGSDVRPRGEEAAAGSVLLEPGGVVTPAVAGLAASTGLDVLPVVRPPDVALVVPGRGRDLLGPVLPGWVAWAGGRAFPPQRAIAGLDEAVELVDDAIADVVLLTGAETADARLAVARLGARWIVDGVDVEPGPESGLAELSDGRLLVLLPADPLGAVSGVVTLLVPLLATLRGELGADEARVERAVIDGDVRLGAEETRLVPVVRRPVGGAVRAQALTDDGPGRLRGLALADGLAVVPRTGVRDDGVVAVLPLP